MSDHHAYIEALSDAECVAYAARLITSAAIDCSRAEYLKERLEDIAFKVGQIAPHDGERLPGGKRE